MSDQPPANVTALLSEAMNKTGVLWVDAEGDRPWPVWHVWDDGAAYVVSGPGEQPLPWLPKDVRLMLKSKDTGGRLLTVPAHTYVLSPESDMWVRAADLLKASRLNAVDDCFTRWANHCTITAFLPYGQPLERPGSYDTGSGRDQPARTAATTTSWRPWHWHGRAGRAAAKARRRATRDAKQAAGAESARLEREQQQQETDRRSAQKAAEKAARHRRG